MKAVVAAFNQEKALVGAFSVITNLLMELFQALLERTYLSINSKSVSLLGMPGTNCFMKLQFDCIHSSDREKIMRKILNLDNDGVGGTKAASAQTALRHPLL